MLSLSLILVLLLPALVLRGAAAQPPLALDLPAIDFGTVARASCHERVLHVVNRSQDTLALCGTDSDCTCLTSGVTPGALAPGGEADWTIVLNTCDYLGDVRRHVWIRTDRRELPQLRLPVRYEVVPEVYAEPGMLSLGLIGPAGADAQAEIRTCSEQSVPLSAATCSAPAVEVQLLGEQATRSQPARLLIRVQSPPASGPLQATVWVETGSGDVPRLRIPLAGEAIAGLRCDRREVVFDAAALGSSQEETLTFTCDPAVQVGGIRTSNEALDVKTVQRDGARVSVTLRSDPKLPLGRFQGCLILDVRDGEPRKVRVPYRGRVIEPPSISAPASQPADPGGRGLAAPPGG